MIPFPTAPDDIIAFLDNWLTETALPLWSGPGLHPTSGLAWEALDLQGQPMPIPVRLRVQARQAYVFARFAAAGTAPDDMLSKAQHLLNWIMVDGHDPATGHLGAISEPDGTLLAAPHDLYDLAFVVLAVAALADAGIDTTTHRVALLSGLETLSADQGWFETAAHRLPRRQNPHMHMFEASTAVFGATGDPAYREIADRCLALFRETFLQPDGLLLEMFNADWTPDAAAQVIEPGHMAEWIWLLSDYERVTGSMSGIDMGPMWDYILAHRTPLGFLPDTSNPLSETCRLWPQSELLRAAIVMQRKGDKRLSAKDVLTDLWTHYLRAPVPGGWVDCLTIDGTPVAQTMPASTFYHVYGALTALTPADLAEGL